MAIGAIRRAAGLLPFLAFRIAFVFSADCDITGFTTIDFLFVRPPLNNGDGTATFLRFSVDDDDTGVAAVAASDDGVVGGMFVVTSRPPPAEAAIFTSFTNGPGAKVVCAPFLLFRLSEL